MNNVSKGYFLGLDMGTNSIGWAVTDSNYNLIRKKGKDCWGIREFDSAESSTARRTNRVSRRRRQREQVRKGLVRSYFADEIAKVDPCFFARLDNSKYLVSDKDEEVQYKSAIFNDSDFSDAEYYKKYPTIFHLRKELLESTEPHDIRLLYLAVSNMFKHRGHFLNESLNSVETEGNIQEIYDAYLELVNPMLDEEEGCFPEIEAKRIIDIIGDKDISRSVKAEKVSAILNTHRIQKQKTEFIRCLCGLKVDARKMFLDVDSETKVEICFNDFSYEDKIPEIISAVGDVNYQVIELLKQLYDEGILSGIRKEFNYLSEARVAEYEKHREDLALLKAVTKKYRPDSYDELFRSKESGSYSAYVNGYNSDGSQRRNMGGAPNRTQEAMYKKIKAMLSGIEDDDVEYIFDEMSKENFLPKQLTAKNGVIPNQLHRMELAKILANAESYCPFLTEKDESGLTVSERIIELFSFQIPYYIGPTSEQSALNGGNGWVVRRNPGEVLPWNMKDKIDIAATSEQFIMRMVRECSYLRGEKVLPKASLEYEAFCVLNEINNIKIDGEKISVELKQDIYRELFQKAKNGKPSRKVLEKYLIGRGVISSASQMTGIDININNGLGSYAKFKNIFGEKINRDDFKSTIERVIFLGTVYGDSKKMFKDSLEKEFANQLSSEEIKRIIGYKFKDWGKLSKVFLELSGCRKDTGELISLIRAMWETNYNLMELLTSSEFSFKDELEDRRNTVLKDFSEFKFEDLNEFYFSPSVKRMVWQTILVVREIIDIMGEEPERIFIEMTRSNQEKGDQGRKDSRKKMLLDLYCNINDELQDWKSLIENADANGRLRSKKMYLYITQMGRDMYTGAPIDLDKLFDDNVYDIDHIYPRSFVKDDNINNNLVLVDKTINNRKQNIYPIDIEIATKPEVKELWKTLHNSGLINDEKYSRLTSRKSFTDEQLAQFIARQIVETSQATKGIADIIKGLCRDTTIVYSKAGNVSEFRHQYEMYKSRLANEFHHAHDAYLNIVVGNVYYVKFTQNPLVYIKSEYSKDSINNHYHLGKMFEYDVTRNGEIAWIAQSTKNNNPGTIAVIKKTMSRNTPIMTRMNYEGHGTLFNLTLYGKDVAKHKNYVPIKGNDSKMADVEKYGGYTSLKPAYFIFIEHGIGRKRKKSFDVVPLIYASHIKNREDLKTYCEKDLGYEDVNIICEKIKKDSLISLDGFLLYLAGLDSRKNVEFHNAVNLFVSTSVNNYIHDIETSMDKHINPRISEEKNIEIYDFLTDKFSNGIWSKHPKCLFEVLKEGREKFVKLTIEEQINVLYKLFQITTIGGNTAVGLKEICGPASDAGRIRISGNMTDRSELLIINQSITGLYSNPLDLLAP